LEDAKWGKINAEGANSRVYRVLYFYYLCERGDPLLGTYAGSHFDTRIGAFYKSLFSFMFSRCPIGTSVKNMAWKV
jgi:hypothetical protein